MSNAMLKRHKGGWNKTGNMGKRKNTFSVVEFIQKPMANIDKYVIVPDSWIKARANKISVLWPKIERVEHLRKYMEMVPHNTPSLNWTEYLSEIKYTAKTFEDAQAYILISSDREINQHNCSGKDDKAVQTENSQEDRVTDPEDIMYTDKEFFLFLGKFTRVFYTCGQQLLELGSMPLRTSSGAAVRILDSKNAHHVEPENVEATPPKKKRAAVILPPEYDANDTRWTLKHRENKPGLEKLLNGYEVYVEEKHLADILNLATEATQLCSLLAFQVFKETALGVCSLIGLKAKRRAIGTRPDLDIDGVNAMIEFIRNWEAKRGWAHVDTSTLIEGIRKKMIFTRKQRETLLNQIGNE